MQAVEIENQNNVSLTIGVILSPSFPFWHIHSVLSLLKLKKPQVWELKTINQHGISMARNRIVQQFLMSGMSHLLFLDSDVILSDENTIAQMLQVEEKVVVANVPQKPYGGVTCIKHSELPFARDAPITFRENELVKEFMLCGFGCVLIQREVLEKMKYPYFRYTSQESGETSDYESVSEDFYFFIKLYEMGIKPIFLPYVKATHVMTSGLTDKGIIPL